MNIGKIRYYNGVFGKIVADNGNMYNFSYNGQEGVVKEGDIVSFKIYNKDIVTDVQIYRNICKEIKELIRIQKNHNYEPTDIGRN